MCDAGGSLICGATDVVNSGTMLRPSRGAGNQLHHQATANPALHSATAATGSTSAMSQVDRVSSDGTSSGLRRKGGSTPLVFGAPAHSTPSTARPDEFSSTTAVAADQDLEGEGRIHRSKTWFLLLLPKLALALIAVVSVSLFLFAGKEISLFPWSSTKQPAWRQSLGECTDPDDGFVHGGDPAKVLTFSRKGRAGQGSGDVQRNDLVDYPALPDVLRSVWESKRDAGVLAYNVAELATRRETGAESGWECMFASNFGRHKPFPPAGPAESPWDPSAFNFYKGSAREFVLSYIPSFRYNREAAAEAAATAGGQSTGSASILPVGAKPSLKLGGEDQDSPVAGLRGGAERQLLEGQAGGQQRRELASIPSVECEDVSTASPPEDAVLVNIRPVGPVSLLLTPGYPHSLKQRATAYSLAVAMDFSEALRSEPGFRLGFNSGGSSASVNHLHFQCWHFDAGPRGLAIEVSPSTHAATIPLRTSSATSPEKGGGGGSSEDSVEVHTLEGYPIMGLVFHTLGKDLEAVGEVIERCINVLIESNTPHTMLFSTGRAFLLPRQPLEEPPFAVVPGFPEVSGEVIVTAEEDFPRITADDVYRWWQEKISVGAEQFGQITRACLS